MLEETMTCPRCSDENAFFNGLTYECPDCGHTWESPFRDPAEEADDSSMERAYRRQDISRVGNRVDEGSFRRLFSPSYRFRKWHTLYRVSGPEEDYYNAVMDSLLSTGRYAGLAAIAASADLAEARRSELFRAVLRDYLESRDDLPAFPKPEEWGSYIDAPIALMQAVCPIDGVDVVQFLPLSVDGEDFTVLFIPRIAAFYDRLVSGSEPPSAEIALRSVERLFTELATGERSDPDDQSRILKHRLETEFREELDAIRRYRDDLSSGVIKTKIAETRTSHLSTGETVVSIVGAYLSSVVDR